MVGIGGLMTALTGASGFFWVNNGFWIRMVGNLCFSIGLFSFL